MHSDGDNSYNLIVRTQLGDKAKRNRKKFKYRIIVGNKKRRFVDTTTTLFNKTRMRWPNNSSSVATENLLAYHFIVHNAYMYING